MKTSYCHLLPLGALSLGGLMLSACAVQQPMARSSYTADQNEQPERAKSLSMFAAKRVRPVAAPAPQPLVAAEPAPEPQPAAEVASAAEPQAAPAPAPEPQPQAAAEPAPKPRGPLTNAEENEIDTQVMP